MCYLTYPAHIHFAHLSTGGVDPAPSFAAAGIARWSKPTLMPSVLYIHTFLFITYAELYVKLRSM